MSVPTAESVLFAALCPAPAPAPAPAVIPPVSNTGGKSTGMGLAWETPLVSIDTFSFSFDGSVFGFDLLGMRKWVNRFTGGGVAGRRVIGAAI